MENDFREQFIRALMRFKKVAMTFHHGADIHMGELMVLSKIQNSSAKFGSVYVSDIQTNLHMSKPAVSQILNTLESKNFISRKIDPGDRRKIAVTITKNGRLALRKALDTSSNALDEVITKFGENNSKEFVFLLNRLADIFEEYNQDLKP